MSAKVSTAMIGDTMRVSVTGARDAREARGLAQKAAGTAAVGSAVPGGKAGTYTVTVSAKALAARKVVGSTPPARTMREKAAPADALATVLASLDPAVAEVIRAALKAQAPVKAPAEPNTFVADVIVPAAKARAERKANARCGTCLDYGIVRGGGERKGQPYSTDNGAANAANAAPCPAKGCKAAKARKAA